MYPQYWLNCKLRPDFDTLITTLPLVDESHKIKCIHIKSKAKRGVLYYLLP